MSPRTPYVLGLTGSIGMGKSTTAQMFADEGLPVWDADATVHRLYQPGQPAALAIGQVFPTAIDPDGSVNRATLRALIEADKTVLDRLNAAVHPLVAADRARFLQANETAEIVLLDVPLLYEIGLDKACDADEIRDERIPRVAIGFGWPRLLLDFARVHDDHLV